LEWGNSHENNLEKPNVRQTEPAKRAIVPVEYHVAMFPEALQRAVSPSEALTRQCANGLRRFCPGDGVGNVNNPLPMSVQRQGKIRVFGKGLQTKTTGLVNCGLADGADCTGHHRDAVPSVVRPPIQIESARVFKRLTARDEGA